MARLAQSESIQGQGPPAMKEAGTAGPGGTRAVAEPACGLEHGQTSLEDPSGQATSLSSGSASQLLEGIPSRWEEERALAAAPWTSPSGLLLVKGRVRARLSLSA